MWPGPHSHVWHSVPIPAPTWAPPTPTAPDDLAKLARQWAIQRGAESSMIMPPSFQAYPAPWPIQTQMPPPPPPPPPPFPAPEPVSVEPPVESCPPVDRINLVEPGRLPDTCQKPPDPPQINEPPWTIPEVDWNNSYATNHEQVTHYCPPGQEPFPFVHDYSHGPVPNFPQPPMPPSGPDPRIPLAFFRHPIPNVYAHQPPVPRPYQPPPPCSREFTHYAPPVPPVQPPSSDVSEFPTTTNQSANEFNDFDYRQPSQFSQPNLTTDEWFANNPSNGATSFQSDSNSSQVSSTTKPTPTLFPIQHAASASTWHSQSSVTNFSSPFPGPAYGTDVPVHHSVTVVSSGTDSLARKRALPAWVREELEKLEKKKAKEVAAATDGLSNAETATRDEEGDIVMDEEDTHLSASKTNGRLEEDEDVTDFIKQHRSGSPDLSAVHSVQLGDDHSDTSAISDDETDEETSKAAGPKAKSLDRPLGDLSSSTPAQLRLLRSPSPEVITKSEFQRIFDDLTEEERQTEEARFITRILTDALLTVTTDLIVEITEEALTSFRRAEQNSTSTVTSSATILTTRTSRFSSLSQPHSSTSQTSSSSDSPGEAPGAANTPVMTQPPQRRRRRFEEAPCSPVVQDGLKLANDGLQTSQVIQAQAISEQNNGNLDEVEEKEKQDSQFLCKSLKPKVEPDILEARVSGSLVGLIAYGSEDEADSEPESEATHTPLSENKVESSDPSSQAHQIDKGSESDKNDKLPIIPTEAIPLPKSETTEIAIASEPAPLDSSTDASAVASNSKTQSISMVPLNSTLLQQLKTELNLREEAKRQTEQVDKTGVRHKNRDTDRPRTYHSSTSVKKESSSRDLHKHRHRSRSPTPASLRTKGEKENIFQNKKDPSKYSTNTSTRSSYASSPRHRHNRRDSSESKRQTSRSRSKRRSDSHRRPSSRHYDRSRNQTSSSSLLASSERRKREDGHKIYAKESTKRHSREPSSRDWHRDRRSRDKSIRSKKDKIKPLRRRRESTGRSASESSRSGNSYSSSSVSARSASISSASNSSASLTSDNSTRRKKKHSHSRRKHKGTKKPQ